MAARAPDSEPLEIPDSFRELEGECPPRGSAGPSRICPAQNTVPRSQVADSDVDVIAAGTEKENDSVQKKRVKRKAAARDAPVAPIQSVIGIEDPEWSTPSSSPPTFHVTAYLPIII